jgi:GLPGLI family protein
LAVRLSLNTMKKFIIILFLFTLNLQSQIKKATYSLQLTKERQDGIARLTRTSVETLQELEKNLFVNLYFNKNEATFKFSKDLYELSPQELPYYTLSKCEDENYYNLKDSIYLAKKLPGSFYCDVPVIIKEKLDFNWKITSESKKINNYTCYKATQVNSDNFALIAWFCPEISYSFGPYVTAGLPGLILELHTNFITYGLLTFEETNDIKEIKIPTAKKVITNEQTKAILKEKTEEIEREINRNK